MWHRHGGTGRRWHEGLDAFGPATWQLRSATVDGQDLTLVEGHPVTLETLVDGETASSTVPGQEPTLTIDGDGQLDGNTGCNEFGATAEIIARRRARARLPQPVAPTSISRW